jgi:signal transduction histidine kinase
VRTIHLAYRSVPAHAALEMAVALAAALAAFLMAGRYRRSNTLSDLLLTSALALYAGTNLLFAAIPAMVSARDSGFAIWAPAVGRMAATALFAAAAWAPQRRLRRPGAASSRAIFGVAAGLAAIGVTAALGSSDLPSGINPTVSPEEQAHPGLVGNGVVVFLQLASTVLFAAAAVGYLRRAERLRDELMVWIAIGAALAAFARVNFALFPSVYSDWVYTGDFLRLGFYSLLVVGILREIAAYQRSLATAAMSEERRRVAREMHDGLAQELAFVAAQARQLADEPAASPRVGELASAAERALDESRGAIAALRLSPDESLDVALAKAATSVANRVRVRPVFDLQPGVEAPWQTREMLVRIAHEAIRNAARHGGATTVTVRLVESGGLRLSIADDGAGFDVESASDEDGGLGIVGMRERAESVGGRLELRSSPGAGTTVEVVLP